VVPHYKTGELNGPRKGSPYHRRGRRLGYETITHGTRKKTFWHADEERRRGVVSVIYYDIIIYILCL